MQHLSQAQLLELALKLSIPRECLESVVKNGSIDGWSENEDKQQRQKVTSPLSSPGSIKQSKKISVKTAAKRQQQDDAAKIYDFDDGNNKKNDETSKRKSGPKSKPKQEKPVKPPNSESKSGKRRRILREQDEDGGGDATEDQSDEWIQKLQPFPNKLYLDFEWKFPQRKHDNPFVPASPRPSSSARNASPSTASSGVVIKKAPKMMMMKKRKSK